MRNLDDVIEELEDLKIIKDNVLVTTFGAVTPSPNIKTSEGLALITLLSVCCMIKMKLNQPSL